MGCGGSKNDTSSSTGRAKTEAPPKQDPPIEPIVEVNEEESGKDIEQVEKTDSPPPAGNNTEGFSEFEQEALKKHNDYRALHGCPPLTLNRDLCTVAQKWSDHLAATKKFEHSSDSGYGENLYSSASSGKEVSGDGATEAWYNEIKDYDFSNPGFAAGTGHFTQVIWKGTTEVGIGAATYEDGGWTHIVVTANYSPAGNLIGAFEENVPRLV